MARMRSMPRSAALLLAGWMAIVSRPILAEDTPNGETASRRWTRPVSPGSRDPDANWLWPWLTAGRRSSSTKNPTEREQHANAASAAEFSTPLRPSTTDESRQTTVEVINSSPRRSRFYDGPMPTVAGARRVYASSDLEPQNPFPVDAAGNPPIEVAADAVAAFGGSAPSLPAGLSLVADDIRTRGVLAITQPREAEIAAEVPADLEPPLPDLPPRLPVAAANPPESIMAPPMPDLKAAAIGDDASAVADIAEIAVPNAEAVEIAAVDINTAAPRSPSDVEPLGSPLHTEVIATETEPTVANPRLDLSILSRPTMPFDPQLAQRCHQVIGKGRIDADREQALLTLARMSGWRQHRPSVALLRQVALRDYNTRMREWAVHMLALAEMDHAAVAQSLRVSAEYDSEPHIRAAAVDYLKRLAGKPVDYFLR